MRDTNTSRPSGHALKRNSLTLLTVGAGLLAGCSSSDDGDTPSGPDTTAPSASSFVQDRTTDPTGATVNVNFSEAVTALTAEVSANYTFSGGLNVVSATLSPSGQTVAIVLDAPAIPGDNTIEVAAGIEDEAGNASEAVAATAITSTDTTAPAAASMAGETIEGAENDTIMVTFSDSMIASEVEMIANWTIESPLGTPFDITGATAIYDEMTQTATVTLGAASADQNLQTTDDIHASFIGMRDLGGNTIGATVIGSSAVSGMVAGDNTPPALLSIIPGAGDTMTLTFTEDVTDMETADLRTMSLPTGTDIVLTDVNSAGTAASGTIELTGVVADGDSVTISDGTTAATFEFDYGSVGSVSLSGLPNDTDSVEINDGTTSVVFEFDDNATATGTSITIGVDAPATIATLITEINSSALTITASAGATTSDLNLRHDSIGDNDQAIVEVDTAGVITFTGMAGGGVTGANVGVAVDTTSEATTVTSLRAAIDGDAFNVTTSAGSAAEDFVLTNDAVGAAGNVAITETDGGSVITLTGMAGGVDGGAVTFIPTVSTAVGTPLQATTTFSITPEAGDTIRIVGVRDLAGNQMFPVVAEAIVAADGTAPSATAGSVDVNVAAGEENDVIALVFDEDVHPSTATDLANYELSDGAAVALDGATIEHSGASVDIILGPDTDVNIDANGTYEVTISNVTNMQGDAMTSEANGGLTPAGDTTAPTISVGDAKLDPVTANSVLVLFSEAVDATGAEDSANYTIAGNTTTAAALVTPRIVRVTFMNEVTTSDTIDIAAAAATDLAQNVAAGVASVAVTAADGVVPTIASIAGLTGTAGGDQINIAFSESIPPMLAETAANFAITSGGNAVDFTGATFVYNSAGTGMTITLDPSQVLLQGDALSVTTTNLTDAAGNAMSAAAVAGAVSGDAVAPASAVAFVNTKADAAGMTVDVQFDEAMDSTATMTIGNWSGSGGQAATAVDQLSDRIFRVTFDAAVGALETIDILTPTDRANNAGATITVDPIE